MLSLTKKILIRIVDDDPDLLESEAFLLRTEGYSVAAYQNALDFLTSDLPSVPGCLILDEQMPGMTGQELLWELNFRQYLIPVIFLTAHGDIDMAVQSMINGAVDFQQKPLCPDKLLRAVARAVQIDVGRRGGAQDIKDELLLYKKLTPREEAVLRLVADGLINKQIGERLGISKRTVDHIRSSAIGKLESRSASELASFFRRIDRYNETYRNH